MQQQQVTVATNPGSVGQPVQLQTTPWVVGTESNVVAKYKHRQSSALGLTLIICGAVSILANIVDIVLFIDATMRRPDGFYFTTLGFAGPGFWCGTVCIIAGGLGLGASKSRKRCMIVGVMVMSIIAAVLSFGQLLSASIGVALTSSQLREYYLYYYDGSTVFVSEIRCIVAMEALMVILALVSAIASIWASAICCQAVCCCTSQPTVVGLVQNTSMNMVGQQGQMVPATYMVAGPNQYNPVQPGQQQQQFVSLPPSYTSQPPAVVSNASNPPTYGVERGAPGGTDDNYDNFGGSGKHGDLQLLLEG